MSGALEGLKVVDLTSHLAGPYCTMMLADQGATVYKVERAGAGDDARNMPPFVNGQSSPFMLWNRNKLSVEIDLKTETGLEACRALIRQSDVLVENFKPGVAERLGLGYETLSAAQPGLVYCSISGYGQTGPYASKGGFDLIMQGISGLMAVTGPVEGEPHRLPIAISDVTAGMLAAFGVLAALQERHRTGRGQQVDVSLLDAAISHGVYEAASYFATGERPNRLGQAHRAGSPYQLFEAADGWIIFGATPENLWQKLCAIVGREDLIADPRFCDNAQRVANNNELVDLLADRLRTRPVADWLAELDAAGIPAGPVLNHDETFADPQVLAREMVAEVDHPVAGPMRTLGTPVKLSATPGGVSRPAPLLGEHTTAVLSVLGLDTSTAANDG